MRQKTVVTVLVSAVLAAAASAGADFMGDACEHRADREAAVDAAGVRAVRIEAKAGSLRVEGRPGQARIEARGTACGSTADILAQVRLSATRQGDTVVVRVETPESDESWGWGSQQARLNLAVSLPPRLPLEVNDGSGAAAITHVGALRVRDGSGEVTVSDVTGDVDVHDGSGALEITRVVGDVRISDGSGSILVRDVQGSVVVTEDGSGGIEVGTVTGSVTVERDGSGSIDVADVRGDFTVRRDGSGGIGHRGVSGRVSIPDED
jgi:hypothetical protein